MVRELGSDITSYSNLIDKAVATIHGAAVELETVQHGLEKLHGMLVQTVGTIASKDEQIHLLGYITCAPCVDATGRG